MNDLDRLLKQSLTEVRESYAEARAPDRIQARARFIERYRRRRILFRAGSAVLVGAAVVAAFAISTGRVQLFANDAAEVAARIGRGVVAQIDTGRDPVDVGLRPDGAWVVHSDDSILSLVNPVTNELEDTIPLDGPAQEVDVGQGGVWVAGFGHVTPVDLQTNELVEPGAKVGLRSDSIEISVGEGAVWAIVANERLVRVDPKTLEVETISGLRAPSDVAAREGAVWVLDEEDGIVRLDPLSGSRVGKRIPLEGTGDISIDSGVVWIGDERSNTVFKIRPRTTAFGGNFHVPGRYVDMAVHDDAVWVLSRQGDRTLLSAIDRVTMRELSEPVSLKAAAVEVSASKDGVWIVSRDEGLLHVDPATILGD